MNICRICLSNSTNKDICELKIDDDSTSFSDILMFCLNIEITQSSSMPTKLCSKCYRKILSYYKFKMLALKTDTYLKTLNLDCLVKLEIVKENFDYSNNNCNLDNIDMIDNVDSSDYEPFGSVKGESNIKMEPAVDEHQPDDEELLMLNAIKSIKEESSFDNIPLNDDQVVVKAIKKRGRKKTIQLKTQSSTNFKMCEECGETVKDLKLHAAKHLPLEERKKIKCKECERTFCTYGGYKKHNMQQHKKSRPRCDLCGKEVYNLKSHILRIHNPEKLKFQCTLCDKRLFSRPLLNSHMLSHTKYKPHECHICQKKFRTPIILKHHIRQVHENEKTHLCQFCSKMFFKKHHLTVHLRSHTKEKPYKCDECERCFTNSTTLKNHKTTHSTEKIYQCDLCQLKFTRLSYLRAHMVCHTKVKRFPCKYCGLKFGRSDHRKRHEFTAHEKHYTTA